MQPYWHGVNRPLGTSRKDTRVRKSWRIPQSSQTWWGYLRRDVISNVMYSQPMLCLLSADGNRICSIQVVMGGQWGFHSSMFCIYLQYTMYRSRGMVELDIGELCCIRPDDILSSYIFCPHSPVWVLRSMKWNNRFINFHENSCDIDLIRRTQEWNCLTSIHWFVEVTCEIGSSPAF